MFDSIRSEWALLVGELRYAPKGAIGYFSADPELLGFASFVSGVFKSAGWRDAGQMKVAPSLSLRTRYEVLFVLTLADRHQTSNAMRAVGKIFARLGFVGMVALGEEEAYVASADHRLRVAIVVGTHPLLRTGSAPNRKVRVEVSH
jgi:hypothetical protein